MLAHYFIYKMSYLFYYCYYNLLLDILFHVILSNRILFASLQSWNLLILVQPGGMLYLYYHIFFWEYWVQDRKEGNLFNLLNTVYEWVSVFECVYVFK